MMKKCTIFTGGEMNDLSIVDVKAVRNTFVICADSGYLYAKRLSITPDLLIGDYDSLGFKPEIDGELITFPVEKDDTDLMLAVKEALRRGYDDVDIYGALGGRLDHTFSNIQSLGYLCKKGAVGRMISENEELTVLEAGEYVIPKREGFSLSLFAYSDNVKGLCISGTKYTAENALLENTFPLGMSNEIVDEQAKISFTSGRLLVIQSKMINLSSKNE